MKRILCSLVLSALTASVVFAADVPAVKAAAPVVVSAAADKAIMGKVKSVSLMDAAKGTKSEIVIIDAASGQVVNLLVKATTTLYDVNIKPTTLDKIAVDSKVVAAFVLSAEGVNEAKSIKIVK